jgi:RNA polymerase sigma factor (sigma-70 family)
MSAAFPSHHAIDEKSPTAPERAPATPAAAEGDDWRARIDRVFRQHRAHIRNRAVQLADRHNADDLVADSFCKLVSSYGRTLNPLTPPDSDTGMLRTVFTTMRNASVDAFRAVEAESEVFIDARIEDVDRAEGADRETGAGVGDVTDRAMPAPVTTGVIDLGHAAIIAAADGADAAELYDLLDHAIASLPEAQDLIVTFRECLGDSRHEVAAECGISVRTVDAHLQAAHAALRTHIVEHAHSLESDRLIEMIRQLARRHAARRAERRTHRECRALMAA